MATINVTAVTASQSLRGQDVVVHLGSTDILTKLPQIEVGQACVIDSSSYTGNVSSVDSFGSSFKITPTMPDGNLSSDSTKGLLAANETITITL